MTLLSGTGTALALSGCVGTRWWEDDENENEDEDAINPGSSEQAETDPTDTNDTDDSSDKTDQEQAKNDESEESRTTGKDDEKQQKPTAEETEIDRDAYEQQKISETEARSSDDIEIEADSHVSNDESAAVAGTVTNVSETPIDVIDLEVIFYGADEEYLSAQLITVTDVGIGESKKFEAEIGPDEAHGQPERVELNPDVYDRAD